MKYGKYCWIVFTMLCSFSIVYGKVYYVATNGNDNNPGSMALPFASWQKGINIAIAGDTIFIRGGVYSPQANTGNIVYINNKHGQPNSRIYILNYLNEKPILDGNDISLRGFVTALKLNNSDYIYIRGLTIRNFKQPSEGGCKGISLQNGSDYNVIKDCDVSYIGGPGIIIDDNNESVCKDNLIYNCDSHHNSDPKSIDPYGSADGFTISAGTNNDHKNTLKHCRSWNNSDDGYDNWNEQGVVIYDSCIAYKNGYFLGAKIDQGDGAGFKLGQTESINDTIRWLNNCISFDNKSNGFTSNDINQTGISVLYKCTAYNNGKYGFSFKNSHHLIINCLAYNNGTDTQFDEGVSELTNSWNFDNLLISKKDLPYFDPSAVSNSLSNFFSFQPDSLSKLVDMGSDFAGYSYFGQNPDIGANEFIPFIMVESIEIFNESESNIISKINGNLKLSYALKPSYATNKKVIWSVINHTGKAIIDDNGLLTAISDGELTVKATSQDGSNISDSISITIKTPFKDITIDRFEIFPNPSNGNIKLLINNKSIEKIYVMVFDITGKIVFESYYPYDSSIMIDLSHLLKGVYLVLVDEKVKRSSKKIIIN
ncbi:MAG: T9SS type A sorting domain-containing protein [Ignavibacteriales bacterium]|nr:T9SS type A sorting domain-containing protein [Ignavibacteriales bacterium]